MSSSSEKSLSDRLDVVRGDLGYGRKIGKRGLAAIAEKAAGAPVDVHYYDSASGKTVINSVWDSNSVVEANREQYLSGHDGYTPDRSMRKVASIPEGWVLELYRRGINVYNDEDWPKVAAILDDPAYWFLRTAPGKISRRPVRTYPTEGWNNQRNPGWLESSTTTTSVKPSKNGSHEET